MVSLAFFSKNGNLMKIFGIIIILALLLLLFKGFSYAVPAISPAGSDYRRSSVNKNLTCRGDFVAKSKCRSCTKLEQELKKDICSATGNIEEIKCKSSTLYLSCPFAVMEEAKKFWIFQACAIGVAILSNILVWWRRQSLDSVTYQRLKRQISDIGV
ncbi:protein JTB-like [Hydractinia symbiolongicarpus]|uniref:protein JTB-like n=1 Tax=Hydractinia symbiolongicarpus TaxID=13093 RepID=UPI00254F9773|nr:protein JTB-like [Hydractinia symbiolongicarpus]XP_057302921.1 protein JTB-like [Hydractinia symbiolongicarpus]